MRSFMLHAALLLSARADNSPLFLSVDCSRAEDGAAATTLHAARDALRAAFAAADASGALRPTATVHVRGPCHLDSPLSFDARDSGPVKWMPAPPLSSFTVSGGAPIAASAFSPVRDPAILAQLPPAARGSVVQLDLAAGGLPAGPGPLAGRGCRAYAEGLPEPHGGSMPGAGVNSPPGLELFASLGGGGATTTPLVLARWPNAWNPLYWSTVLHSAQTGPSNRTMGPDAVTLARSASWAQQFREDPGSIFVHQYNRVGWADMHWPLEGLTARNMTFGGCGNMSVGEHVLETGNYFFSYNILAELDEPGEYYVNRTSNMLYAWLPAGAAPDANGTAAWASLLEAPLLDLSGVAGATWVGASFRYGRGVGVSCVNCSGVSLVDCEVAMVGLMAVNVSGGEGVLLRNLSVSGAGNGGVYLYAGDRATLRPANHTLLDSRVTAYNRWTHCYTPGVVLGGVGNRVVGTRVWDAPHNAIFLSGNNHLIEGCDVSEVVRIVKDSGAFYSGRDLTYRGNVLKDNAWHDINSVFPGPPALYFDDCVSSFAVFNNTFRNISGPAAALEGGKGYTFFDNYVGEDAQGVHAVGKGCSGALPYLALVPWNTSAAWLAAYPELVPEVAQNPDAPWHLVFVNNTRCAPRANSSAATPFVDMSSATAAKYNGSIDGGVNRCRGPAPPWVGAPVRGWNSWTAFGCGVTDADLRATADALVATGLAKAGYSFVGPDDCWAHSRAADGTPLPDPVAFPEGMAAVAAYVRSRGLSFGMYTAIGNKTCAGRPGSAGFEVVDAATFASWGVTWLKLDNCDYPHWDPAILYETWAAALDAQPYRIPLAAKAVVNYSTALRVAASRRVGGDVSATWRDVLGLAYMAEPLFAQARAGNAALGRTSFWTDVELLQVGNGRLSADEAAAHFWLWAALHAPLVLSTRIQDLAPAEVALLTNPEVLAVNADGGGAQARRVALQAAPAPPTLPLAPMALACSLPPLIAPGQAWEAAPAPAPAPAGAFQLRLRPGSGPAAGLCLLRPDCGRGGSASEVAVDACPAPGAGCEGGAGALWAWGGGGVGLVSLAAAGGCVTVEPRLAVARCDAGEPYQQLQWVSGTGQVAMNFTGSGALADYTGYPQCVDAVPGTHAELWAASLENEDLALLALNPTNASVDMEVDVVAVCDALGRQRVKGVRALRDLGRRANETVPQALRFNVSAMPAHGARFLRLVVS